MNQLGSEPTIGNASVRGLCFDVSLATYKLVIFGSIHLVAQNHQSSPADALLRDSPLFRSPWPSAVSHVPHVMSYVLKEASCVRLSGVVDIQEMHASPSLVRFLSTTGPGTLQSQISVPLC